jgi:hypothetical protein
VNEHEAGIHFIISGLSVVSTVAATTAFMHINKLSCRANQPMVTHDATVQPTHPLDMAVL